MKLKLAACIAATTVIVTLACSSALASPFKFEFEELAPGVIAAVRPDGPRFPVMGSATIVIDDDAVVVFDGGGMPVMAEQLIEKIRSLTDAPVKYVVISHWHGDHSFGVFRFAEEYPKVKFIAQMFTREAMMSRKIQYIEGYPDFGKTRIPRFKTRLASGTKEDGTPLSHSERIDYQRIVEHADEIDAEFKRAKITLPDITVAKRMTINTANRRIELRSLGYGNTEGELVMWLPKERVVATGDLVVLPTPYAFNVPPRAWAKTLRKLNALDYKTLVPGHGAIQRDTQYVDLIIETAETIADQRDLMVRDGLSAEEVEQRLDFSAFENRFTNSDPYVTDFYQAYFERPFRKAALKELTGEPMVELLPKE